MDADILTKELQCLPECRCLISVSLSLPDIQMETDMWTQERSCFEEDRQSSLVHMVVNVRFGTAGVLLSVGSQFMDCTSVILWPGSVTPVRTPPTGGNSPFAPQCVRCRLSSPPQCLSGRHVASQTHHLPALIPPPFACHADVPVVEPPQRTSPVLGVPFSGARVLCRQRFISTVASLFLKTVSSFWIGRGGGGVNLCSSRS